MSRLERGGLVYVARQYRCGNAAKFIGDRIRQLRCGARVSQEDFAGRRGFARRHMSRATRGTSDLSLDVVERLATALGISAGELSNGL